MANTVQFLLPSTAQQTYDPFPDATDKMKFQNLKCDLVMRMVCQDHLSKTSNQDLRQHLVTQIASYTSKIEEWKAQLGLFATTIPNETIIIETYKQSGLFKAADLVYDCDHLKAMSENYKHLQTLDALLKNPNAKDDDLVTAFKALSIQPKLIQNSWLLLGAPKDVSLEKIKLDLEKADGIRFHLGRKTIPLLHKQGDSLCGQMIKEISERIELEESIRTNRKSQSDFESLYFKQKKDHFLWLHHNNLATHRQLKALYKQLPADFQQDCPKPPYYLNGINPNLYQELGSHQLPSGAYKFSLFAPNAKNIDLIFTAYDTDLKKMPMIFEPDTGRWHLEVANVNPQQTYVFDITDKQGKILRKIDPFGFHSIKKDKPFRYESQIWDPKSYKWSDHEWMSKRSQLSLQPQPERIYEVYPWAWKKIHNKTMSWRELADITNSESLINYIKKNGYSAVQLMGVMEYPSHCSWGYLVTGHFTPTDRLGTPRDLQFFIEVFHKHNISVIIDFVANHTSKSDSFGLANFDGSPLFETDENNNWGAAFFNFESDFVRNFNLSAGNFWAKIYHFDGFRIDAVTAMIDKNFQSPYPSDYKKHPNLKHGGVLFSRQLTELLRKEGVKLYAEDAWCFPGTTHNAKDKYQIKRGLGFDRQWSLGWEHDSLNFFKTPLLERTSKFSSIKNAVFAVAKGEKIVATQSHDLAVHAKGTLFQKLPGTNKDKFAGIRQYLAYQYSILGDVLLFMGYDFGQKEEWDHLYQLSLKNPLHYSKSAVSWELLSEVPHIGIQEMVKNLNLMLASLPELCNPDQGTQYLIVNDNTNLVFATMRSKKEPSYNKGIICIHNFTNKDQEEYVFSLQQQEDGPNLAKTAQAEEIFNSANVSYGGWVSEKGKAKIIKNPNGSTDLSVNLPRLSSIYVKVQWNA